MRPEKMERNKRIVKDWKNGLSFRKIGEIYGIKGSTVYDIIDRHIPKKVRQKDVRVIHS